MGNVGQIKKRDFLLKSFFFWELFTKPFLLVMTLFALLLLDAQSRQIALQKAGLNPFYGSFLILLVIAQVICAIAIWKWKKWGVYSLFLLEFLPWLWGSIGSWPPHILNLLSFGLIYF